MAIVKKFNGPKNTKIEVFSTNIHGKKIFFVSKITNKKISTGQAKNKTHALKWAKKLSI